MMTLEQCDAEQILYEDAVRLTFHHGKPSESLLQRKLRVGYSQAAMMLDRMAREGLIDRAKREIIAKIEERGK